MGAACQLCGQDRFETVSERDRHGKPLRTVLCLGCGIVTNDPIPSEEELAAFYRSDYRRAYKGAEEPRMRQVWRNFLRLERHFRANAGFYRAGMRCLDLGSGSGEFLYLARGLGMDCLGIEPNEPYAAYSRDTLGLNVLTRSLEETEFPAGRFDLIRLNHVVEHMRDPVRSLRTLSAWLADGGLVYIAVPNLLAEAATRPRGRLFHYGHIFNFSPRTLRTAAGLAGLVEHPASAARYADDTCGFFLAGERPLSRAEAADPANAERMAAALKGNAARLVPARHPAPDLTGDRLALFTRLSAFAIPLRFRSPRAIAEHFAGRLAQAAAR